VRNVADENRSARFRCVIALARNGKLLGTFEGAVEGNIVDPPRGAGGFGYDPVFQPDGFAQTFAEMPSELKNKISHRAQAIAALREALREIRN
jgi:XTP/dITP diphosphohydrolase